MNHDLRYAGLYKLGEAYLRRLSSRRQPYRRQVAPFRLLCFIEDDDVGGVALARAGDDDGILSVSAKADPPLVHVIEVDARSAGFRRRTGEVGGHDAQLSCQLTALQSTPAAQRVDHRIGFVGFRVLVLFLQEWNLSEHDRCEADEEQRAANLH